MKMIRVERIDGDGFKSIAYVDVYRVIDIVVDYAANNVRHTYINLIRSRGIFVTQTPDEVYNLMKEEA